MLLSLESSVHFTCFDEMAKHDLNERYGLRPVAVINCCYIPFAGERLSEEQERQNQDNKGNARLQNEYNYLQQKLLNLLDDKIFYADSLALIASHVSGGALHHVLRERLEYEKANEDLDLPLSERKRNIKIRLRDAGLTLPVVIKTLNTLSQILLSRSSEHLDHPEPKTLGIFYRVVLSNSHGRYDEHLGFRSLRQPLTSPSNHRGPLNESSLVDKDILKNHREGNQPSDLITMFDSPARVFRFTEHCDFKDLRVAVINASKLLATSPIQSHNYFG